MQITSRMIYEGAPIPRWFGLSYYDVCMRVWVCHPVPFNLLVRWCRAVWFAVARSHQKDFAERAYQIGHQDGYRAGRRNIDLLIDILSERAK